MSRIVRNGPEWGWRHYDNCITTPFTGLDDYEREELSKRVWMQFNEIQALEGCQCQWWPWAGFLEESEGCSCGGAHYDDWLEEAINFVHANMDDFVKEINANRWEDCYHDRENRRFISMGDY